MFTNSPSNTITNPHEQKAAKGLLNVSSQKTKLATFVKNEKII